MLIRCFFVFFTGHIAPRRSDVKLRYNLISYREFFYSILLTGIQTTAEVRMSFPTWHFLHIFSLSFQMYTAYTLIEEIFLLSFSVPFNYSRNSAPSILWCKPDVYHSG